MVRRYPSLQFLVKAHCTTKYRDWAYALDISKAGASKVSNKSSTLITQNIIIRSFKEKFSFGARLGQVKNIYILVWGWHSIPNYIWYLESLKDLVQPFCQIWLVHHIIADKQRLIYTCRHAFKQSAHFFKILKYIQNRGNFTLRTGLAVIVDGHFANSPPWWLCWVGNFPGLTVVSAICSQHRRSAEG